MSNSKTQEERLDYLVEEFKADSDEYKDLQTSKSVEKKGTPIGPLDMMIAGHAMSMGNTVVTNNVKEFTRVPYLKIENWAE